MDVVAEGVETAGQARALRKSECPFAQGYFFGRPGDAAKLSMPLPRERAAARRKPLRRGRT
jgi:EAL domain-containing protein (putative c-di-GMP-specific phosphodiesterase class I)